jgi:opacity protein-like surface antigen
MDAGMSPHSISLQGADATLTDEFTPKFAAQADLGYVRAVNVFHSGKHSDMLSYLGGPVFYPIRNKRRGIYARALFGGVRTTGATPSSVGFVTGYVNKFGWNVGAGLEYRLSESFLLRAGADYLHSYFIAPTGVVSGQNNFRTTFSIVYVFRTRRR